MSRPAPAVLCLSGSAGAGGCLRLRPCPPAGASDEPPMLRGATGSVQRVGNGGICFFFTFFIARRTYSVGMEHKKRRTIELHPGTSSGAAAGVLHFHWLILRAEWGYSSPVDVGGQPRSFPAS